jgi:hypothetical protein
MYIGKSFIELTDILASLQVRDTALPQAWTISSHVFKEDVFARSSCDNNSFKNCKHTVNNVKFVRAKLHIQLQHKCQLFHGAVLYTVALNNNKSQQS